MIGISFHQKGDFKNTEKFLNTPINQRIRKILEKYGNDGVAALSKATPKDSGLTARSWFYEVKETRDSLSLEFYNTNVNKGCNIAIVLQYGHGIWNAGMHNNERAVGRGYIPGIDYINPALRPIFDKIVDEMWEEVKKS